jgi:hypothetical protein
MLSWRPGEALALGRLADQGAWYARVIESQGIQPATEEVLSADRFPARFVGHVRRALDVYEAAKEDLKRMVLEGGESKGARVHDAPYERRECPLGRTNGPPLLEPA